MKKQSLNGKWSYRVGGGAEREREVPYSALAVGHSECRRYFDLDVSSERVFLQFDGITYHAEVFLNGTHLGEMTAYSEYRFDITDIVKAKDNELKVVLEDISPVFGPTAGWENYGGVIRDVSLLYCGKEYVKDVFFHTELENSYRAARYTLEFELSSDTEGELFVSLTHGGERADAFSVSASTKKVTRQLENVKLWSTDAPELYKLSVSLAVNGSTVDEYCCNVGFREIKCDRHRFIINGKPTFLQGVCKHEMFPGCGHTVSAEQIEKDLRMIKETGCNFVRLVHYPHNKVTLDIADRLGIMVSEEPGLWWSDTSEPQVRKNSLEVLKRTVLRDRNHPCIAFWLCFNECRFTEEYLVSAARVCRENDPTRLVSGANCMSDEDTLKYYNMCGFDFYTMHPYSNTFERSRRSISLLTDRPLIFTEWGGHDVYDNPSLLSDFIHEMYGAYKANSDGNALAGAFFWYWAEANDYGRGRPACVDGVLKEALVNGDRVPNLIYGAFCEAWADAKKEKSYEDNYYFEALDKMEKAPLEHVSGGESYNSFLERAQKYDREARKYNGMRARKLTVGPKLLGNDIKGVSPVPYVVSDGEKVVFDCGRKTSELTLLGLVSASVGYPLGGDYGETAAELTLEYESGEREQMPIRNGIELTTVYTTSGSSRIDPIAEKAKRFARFGYDKNFENYIINRLNIPLENKSTLKRVTLTSSSLAYDILVYGIFA